MAGEANPPCLTIGCQVPITCSNRSWYVWKQHLNRHKNGGRRSLWLAELQGMHQTIEINAHYDIWFPPILHSCLPHKHELPLLLMPLLNVWRPRHEITYIVFRRWPLLWLPLLQVIQQLFRIIHLSWVHQGIIMSSFHTTHNTLVVQRATFPTKTGATILRTWWVTPEQFSDQRVNCCSTVSELQVSPRSSHENLE